MLRRGAMLAAAQRHGINFVAEHLTTALQEGEIKPEELSLQEMAMSLIEGQDGKPVGWEWIQQLGPQRSGGVQLREATSAVTLSQFSNVNGQWLYSQVMDGFNVEGTVISSLVSEEQTDFSGEKIPGLTGLREEDVMEVQELMPYPRVGFGEDYIETPATTKEGVIISISKETLFFDRTKRIGQQARTVGQVLLWRKEKKIVDVMFGFTNPYKWRGTNYNTFLTTGSWVNRRTGVSVTDWNDIDATENLFDELIDPATGEPIEPNDRSTIVAMPSRKSLFKRILSATELRETTNTNTQTISGNPLDNYNLVTSRRAYRRLIQNGLSTSNAADRWLLGNPQRAFAWQYNWPLTVVQAPANSQASFEQDIELEYKASHRGSAMVKEPREVVMVQNGG